MQVLKYTLAAALAFFVHSCSRLGDDQDPGGCTRKCNLGKTATDGMTIDFPENYAASAEFKCANTSKDADFTKPQTVLFRMSTKKTTTEGTKTVPAAAVFFTPMIQGSLSVTHVASQTVDSCVTSDPFCGVWTPSEDFCTDSCGIAKLEVWGTYIATKSFVTSVAIKAGSVVSPSFKLTSNCSAE